MTKRNDRRFCKGGSTDRQFQNIKWIVRHYDEVAEIIHCDDDFNLHLINMDAFWDLSPDKQTKQYSLLKLTNQKS